MYSRDSIDNAIFSLHLALNTWRDKGIQSFLTIPDIDFILKCTPQKQNKNSVFVLHHRRAFYRLHSHFN